MNPSPEEVASRLVNVLTELEAAGHLDQTAGANWILWIILLAALVLVATVIYHGWLSLYWHFRCRRFPQELGTKLYLAEQAAAEASQPREAVAAAEEALRLGMNSPRWTQATKVAHVALRDARLLSVVPLAFSGTHYGGRGTVVCPGCGWEEELVVRLPGKTQAAVCVECDIPFRVFWVSTELARLARERRTW